MNIIYIEKALGLHYSFNSFIEIARLMHVVDCTEFLPAQVVGSKIMKLDSVTGNTVRSLTVAGTPLISIEKSTGNLLITER